MQNEHETLGEIIKNARIKADITVEDLAAKVGVTERFIYRIENEGKKPKMCIRDSAKAAGMCLMNGYAVFKVP